MGKEPERWGNNKGWTLDWTQLFYHIQCDFSGMDPAEPTGVTLVARRRSDFISCTLEQFLPSGVDSTEPTGELGINKLCQLNFRQPKAFENYAEIIGTLADFPPKRMTKNLLMLKKLGDTGPVEDTVPSLLEWLKKPYQLTLARGCKVTKKPLRREERKNRGVQWPNRSQSHRE